MTTTKGRSTRDKAVTKATKKAAKKVAKKAAKKATTSKAPGKRSTGTRARKSVGTAPRKSLGHPLSRLFSRAAVLLGDDLPKGLAVANAVSSALVNDKRWPPNDLNRTMDSYHYNVNTLANLLTDVRNTLLATHPSYVFTFDAAFVAASLPLTVAALTGSIDDNTVGAAS